MTTTLATASASPVSEEDMENLVMAMTSVLGIVVAAALTATCVCCCGCGFGGRKHPHEPPPTNPTSTRTTREAEPAAAAAASPTAKNHRIPRIQPPHVLLPAATAKTATKGVSLPGGIVPFKFTQASAAVDRDQAETFRRDRARILARLWTATSMSAEEAPPSRGSNVVITIAPSSQMACPKLRHVLTLLGSYYNLFVILDWTQSSDDHQKSFQDAKDTLCGSAENPGSVSSAILPRHRIIACQSTAGRVAFVRQLHQPKLIIDHDVSVRDELARFGINVSLYPLQGDEEEKQECDLQHRSSPLGRLLKPHE